MCMHLIKLYLRGQGMRDMHMDQSMSPYRPELAEGNTAITTLALS